jgi:LEA14-like dessication related protein
MEKKFIYGVIVIIVIIVVILAGLYIAVDEPTVDVKDIQYKSLSFSEPSISFDVTLNVNNDNPFGATLRRVEADVYINGDYIGETFSESEFEIKSNDVSEVVVVLKVRNVPLDVLSDNTIDVRVTGTAYLKVAMFNFDVPLDETRTVNLG